MSSIRKKLKQISFLNDWYQKVKIDNKTKCKHSFIDRRKNTEKVCLILSGYKEFSYKSVFGRVKKFAPDDLDICVITSGKWSDKINQICAKNQWSYLSTDINNVALVQNLAITLHPKAKFIFKLDEDIFITENYFEKMLNCLQMAENQGDYNIGFVSPVIPVNGVGHKLILKEENLEDEYSKRFEPPKYDIIHMKLFNDPDVSKFFWGEGDYVPGIDELNKKYEKYKGRYHVIPIRFSIGAILFRRELFNEMGFFEVDRHDTNMGKDEVQLCRFCLDNAKAMIVTLDTVVGHLSFGNQNEEMKKYYSTHKEKFEIGE